MATIVNTSTASAARSAVGQSNYDKWIEKLKFSYFGIISITILVGSIIGGITAMYILENDAPIWQLGLCMSISMANNVAAIGQAPTKWVVNLFIASLAVNFLLILMNMI